MLRWVFVVLALCSVEAFAQKPTVYIREMSTVRMNEPIHLLNVADFESVPEELSNKISSLVIHEGINKEGDQDIGNTLLVSTLRSRLSFADLQKITFKVPQKVTFKGSRNHLYSADLMRQVRSHAASLCGDNCVIEITDFNLPVISNNTEVISYKMETRAMRQAGSFVLPLAVETSRGRQNLWVTGQVRLRQPALISTRLIQMGERVKESDFREDIIDISFSKDGLPAKQDLVGKIASRPIRSGQAVYFADLRAANAAERGQPVKVLIGDESFEVSTTGVAEQAGTLGQLIRVRTADKNILMGELVDERVVRVK